ncbi:MAG: hypothetical protein SXQ77_09170, partial [Halobacteria archaeon]|nr:hypothetical protein [Halobacteria archaeon]
DKKDTFALHWVIHSTDVGQIDGPSPTDAAVLAWDESQWGMGDLDNVSCDVVGWHDGNSQSVDTTLAGGGLIGDYNNGVGYKIDDAAAPGVPYSKMEGLLVVPLERQGYPNRQSGRVETLLQHTWSFAGTAYWDFLQGVSITAGGSIGLTIPFEADSWDDPPRLDMDV